MKQLSFFLIINILSSLLIYSTICSNSELEKSRNHIHNNILWEGWVKYFRYQNSVPNSKPTHFFINQEYSHQKVLKNKRAQKDSSGLYINIPTKFHFYAKLLDSKNGSSLKILSSREIEVHKTIDALNLELIKLLPKEKPFTNQRSSIKNLGNFNEGYCISVSTEIPQNPDETFDINEHKNGVSENWIICVDTEKQRDVLFGGLIRKKLLIQKEKEQMDEEKRLKEEINPTKMSNILTPKKTSRIERYKGPGASPNDGYLILLQDWSPCSVKCGGGERVQQWMCVPPKKGGKNCQGDLIRKMKCNSQPCPGTITNPFNVNNKKKPTDPDTVIKKPIYKSLPFSNRPQQYVKCEIRENDILLSQKFPGFVKRINTPARIVMNRRTISVFTDDEYKNSLFNFDLKKTELLPTSDDHCCFKLKSENKSFRICSFGQDCGDLTNPKFLTDWKYAFSLFKNKCYDHFDKADASKSVGLLPRNGDSELDDSLQMSLAEDVVDERQKLIKKKMDNSLEIGLEKRVEQSQKLALRAIKKELNLEEMIKKEEIMKAKEEANELVKLMKHEQKKKEKLEQALRERELENQRIRQVKEVQSQINKIQSEAKKEVEIKREQLKKKILEIRKKAARRKRMIEHQINLIRGQMAKDILMANKEGDMNICKNNRHDQHKINDYCNRHIVDDYAKNVECKSMDSFCYVCCESEYGSMFMNKRDECYTLCDKSIQHEIKSGEFEWQN